MNKQELDILLERWDQTDPAIQRGIVAKFAKMVVVLQDEKAELLDALEAAYENLDYFHTPLDVRETAKTVIAKAKRGAT